MLPFDDIILRKITDICHAGFTSRLHDHPPNVRPQQSFVGIVRIEVGIRIAVMSTVATSPPSDGTLDGTGTEHGKRILQRSRSVVRTMCPKPVVTSRYA